MYHEFVVNFIQKLLDWLLNNKLELKQITNILIQEESQIIYN